MKLKMKKTGPVFIIIIITLHLFIAVDVAVMLELGNKTPRPGNKIKKEPLVSGGNYRVCLSFYWPLSNKEPS